MAKQKQRPAPTDKQASTLRFIQAYITRKKEAPTIFEIAVAEQVTMSAIQNRLEGLEKKGYISRVAAVGRSIQIIP